MAVFVVSGSHRQRKPERRDRSARPHGGGGRASARARSSSPRSAEKTAPKISVQVRRQGQGQGDGDLHPPVLHHDRRRPAAGAVPQHPRRAERVEERSATSPDRSPVTSRQGSTLADALRRHPRTFDDLFTNMVEVGEAGGILDAVLQRLAAYIEKAAALKRKVKAAMVYPAAHHRRGDAGRHLHADLRDPDLRPDVQGPGRRPAAADADRHLALRLRARATSC